MSGGRVVRKLGWLFTVVGLALLAWAFATWRWGDPVTSLYTRWQQRQLAEEYQRIAPRYRSAAGRAALTRSSHTDLRRAARRLRIEARRGEPIGRIGIDRLGVNLILVNGTDATSLRKGPGRDLRTFLPGEGELVYIAGHRTTFGAPFAHIDRLRPGDRVVLEMPYGRFVYAVTHWVVVPASDLDRLRSRGREEVALQACHPRFSARQRYIVYARPVSPVPTIGDRGTGS